jgi:methionyl-tRNA formyltransferase
MGTPHFAIGPLEALTKSKHQVVVVVTAADKKSGRGKKISPSPVKTFSQDNKLPLLQPANLKDPDFINELSAFQPDIIVVVAFRMLPRAVWELPPYGTFNLHASLLPQYRGAAPIHWAVINGDKETGVTTFFIDQNIDTGAVIAQKKIEIQPHETTGSLSKKLESLGSSLVVETVDMIASNKVTPQPQVCSKDLKSAPKLFKVNTRIDWDKSGKEIERLIRGLHPSPTAWTQLVNSGDSQTCKIHEAIFEPHEHNRSNGSIFIKDKQIFVNVIGGILKICKIQLPNKKSLSSKELLNGFSFTEGAYFV